MKKKITYIIIIILILLVLGLKLNFFYFIDNEGKVYVNKVIDGDTIEITGGRKVRLLGVDTPEIRDDNNDEYFAQKAFRYTKKKLEGKQVFLKYDIEERDEYGRILAYVFLRDGTFFNADLLENGYASLMIITPNDKYKKKFKKLVKEARKSNRGLWQGNFDQSLPVISWEKAGNYLGEKVVITGKIVDSYNSDQAIFLNFSRDYSHELTAVIFTHDLYKFAIDPITYFAHKKVKIKGKISEFEGTPEIIVENPEQIINY